MSSRKSLRIVLVATLMLSLGIPLSATTLIRQSLDGLVASNETIVIGEVLDAFSYWNEDGSFILTDVRVLTTDVLKGRLAGDEVTVTLMGGTVGDLSALILGGATLEPGKSYVLFLDREDLPGAPAVQTVRDHVQGAFEVLQIGEDLRAISQANSHPLMADRQGFVDAAGGEDGYPLEAMIETMREIAKNSAARGASHVH